MRFPPAIEVFHIKPAQPCTAGQLDEVRKPACISIVADEDVRAGLAVLLAFPGCRGRATLMSSIMAAACRATGRVRRRRAKSAWSRSNSSKMRSMSRLM